MTDRVTIPMLAERIDTNKRAEKEQFDSVKAELKAMREEFNGKFARVYGLLGSVLASIIVGIVVAIVTR